MDLVLFDGPVAVAPLRQSRQKGDGVKGDRIEVLVDVGSGVKTFEVVASRVVALVEYPAADIQRSQPGEQPGGTATLTTGEEKGGPADRSRV